MKEKRIRYLAILAIALVMSVMVLACQAPPAQTNPPPTPTPTPALLPDPKTDPEGALNYATDNELVQSLGFTMSMSMTLQPADEEAATALGSAVAGALQMANFTGSGSGVMQVIDRAADRANMRVTLEGNAAGQDLTIETIVLDDKAWTRVGPGGWTRSNVETAGSSLLGGIDPLGMEDMLQDAIDVEYIGEEVRDDQSLHHLRVALDPASVDLGAILGTTTASQDELRRLLPEASIDSDVWLGVDDLIPRYQDMNMDLVLPGLALGVGDGRLRMALNISMAFTGINQPVVIEDPTTP